MRFTTRLLALGLCLLAVGCSPEPEFEPEVYNQWVRYETPDAVCANGTPYEYFVWFSETSSNVIVSLEAGGACWDYESCTNDRPFNTDCVEDPNADCVRDDYATAYRQVDIPPNLAGVAEQFGIIDGNVPIDLLFPPLSPNEHANPMAEWNKVFFPYCTGDTHAGNTVRTYTDPAGAGPDLTFHHRGFANVATVTRDLGHMFTDIPQLMVSGCSAGGLGSVANYSQLRAALRPERGYMLADGAPAVPPELVNGDPAHSLQLHQTVREAWDLSALVASIPGAEPTTPIGDANTLLAQAFPNDRLSVTTFMRDYNFPLRGYVGFVPFFDTNPPETPEGRTEVYRLWDEEMEALRATFEPHPNLAYYLPYYRDTNSSHCLTVAAVDEFASLEDFAVAAIGDPEHALWTGTEIDTQNLRTHIENVLDDSAPLESHFESTCEGRYQVCALDCPTYDAALCAAEVNAP